MTIKRYRADVFRQFQKSAMQARGGEMQTAILRAARNREGRDFVDWLESAMRRCAETDDIFVGDEEPAMPIEPAKYSAPDFLLPCADTSAKMWQAWQGITPGIACSPATWAYIVARLIAAEKIKPDYLISETNGAETRGKAAIDKALNATGEIAGGGGEIDKCVRKFLRRLSGLLERGARSVYENCPPARAWWQHHIARQVAENIGGDKDAAMALLKEPGVWAPLTEKMASRLTVIGDRNLRDGIVMFLLEPAGGRFKGSKKMNPLLADIGVMCAWRALGFFSPARVKEILAKEIAPHLSG